MIEYNDIGLDNKMIPMDSPYYRTMEETTLLTDRTSITATSLGKGMITTPINLGSSGVGGYIQIDGPNKRIIINDGTTDRVLIGYDADGF